MVVVLGFLFGLIIGSFLNVVIFRFETKRSALQGRSRCLACQRQLRWFELLPIVSFLFQRGRCRTCHSPLSIQYPVIELVTALTTAGVFGWTDLSAPERFGFLIILWTALIIVAIDVRQLLIPDRALFGLLVGVAVEQASRLTTNQISLGVIMIGGAAGFGILGAIYGLSRGRAMGFGDVKLAGVLGLLLGWPEIVLGLLLAFISGAVWGITLLLFRRANWQDPVPFGPFLLLGAVLAMIGGQNLLAWWLGY